MTAFGKFSSALLFGTMSAVLLRHTPAIAQEMTLILCETDRTAVRVYEKKEQILMRGYNRKLKKTWMNETPTVIQVNDTGVEYRNRSGELNTTVVVNKQSTHCSIQSADQPIEPGKILVDHQGTAIIGAVTYRARVGLSRGALVKTKLLDLSQGSTVTEQTTITSGEQVPIPFSLFYRSSDIDASHRYGVSAEIFVTDELRWVTTTDYPVLTQGSPSVIEVVVGIANETENESKNPIQKGLEPLPEAILTAVKASLIEEVGDRLLQVGNYSRETWSDGCLGLGGPAESCLAALTEGWQVELIDSTNGQSYIYRTNLKGNHVRRSNLKRN